MTTFMSPPPAATFLAFHPQDNNIIAIGMEDSTIQIYNVRIDEVIAWLLQSSILFCCLNCHCRFVGRRSVPMFLFIGALSDLLCFAPKILNASFCFMFTLIISWAIYFFSLFQTSFQKHGNFFKMLTLFVFCFQLCNFSYLYFVCTG